MKTVKDGNRKQDQKKWMNRDREISKRSSMSGMGDDPYDSLREDMRGAMEDMDDEDAQPLHKKRAKRSARQSDSMVNEGGHP